MKNEKDVFKYAYTIAFLLLLLVPLFLTNTKAGAYSSIDNRYLQELPIIGEERFTDTFETYIDDRIGLKDNMTAYYQMLNYAITGELVHPSYCVGKDGHVFFKMHNNIKYGEYQQVFAEEVIKIKEYCESRGVPFYFMLDPEKISVYRQFLPKGVNYEDEWTDELIGKLEANGVTCIYNRDLLIEKSYDEQVFNQKYDAGHWNDLGAFYATNNLWHTVNREYSSVTECSQDEFYRTIKEINYLPISKFPISENTPVYKSKTKYTKSSKYIYEDVKKDSSYRYFNYFINKEQCAEQYPKALIFQGSYYNRNPEFFLNRTREYVGIHDYQNVIDIDYYFNIFQPEIVVFEVAEYAFDDGYFNSERMKNAEYNPPLVDYKSDVSIEDSIRRVKEAAIDFSIPEEKGLHIITRKGIDLVYLEYDLPDADYVYLASKDIIIDMKRDGFGLYSASVLHGSVEGPATIIFKDKYGKTYYSELDIQPTRIYTSAHMTASAGETHNMATDRRVFTIRDIWDSFDGIKIQLLDASTKRCICNILSISEAGTFESTYDHKGVSGWYIIRLLGDASENDEYAEMPVYLTKDNRYYIALDVYSFESKKFEIENFEFF